MVLVCCLSSLAASGERDELALTNPLLGPEYAQWLVGAVGRIATPAEQAEYLSLDNDAAAAEFVTRFWSAAGRETIRALYEERAQIADKRYTESAYPGRKTDRGTVFILYGEPEKQEFEDGRHIDDPPVELWRYSKKAPTGLDGKRPDRVYRFVKIGDVTRRFRRGGPDDPARQRQRFPPHVRRPPGQ